MCEALCFTYFASKGCFGGGLCFHLTLWATEVNLPPAMCLSAADLLTRQVGIGDLVHHHQGGEERQQEKGPPGNPFHRGLEPV